MIDGERKTVSALFADIKGSTELEQDLDPEEARAIIDPALKLMIDAVRRYEGCIVQSTGDGIFALFGAPVAHEDHPQRALYAALRMQQELKSYSTRLREAGNLPIEARVGVNTGEVVVRSISTGGGHTEYTPIGHTTNLASRMQALAPTGSVAITEQTRKLVEGYFALKPLGPTKVKGVSEPVNVYEVTGLGLLRTRLQRSAGRGLTKFVGREREMGLMRAAAEDASRGRGQVVAVVGEAGVGKSRLFYEFKAIAQSTSMVLEAFTVSHGKATAYFPMIDLLNSYFGIEPGDDSRKRIEKVSGRIVTLDATLEDVRRYLLRLMGLEDDNTLAQMDPQILKRRTLESLKRIVLRESVNQPVVLIFEDLHWIDPDTQDFLTVLADSIATSRVMLAANYRPEYRPQWTSRAYHSQLALAPLPAKSSQELLDSLLGDNDDLSRLKKLIIEKSEGTPFYIEELVQALFEQGVLARNGRIVLNRPVDDIKLPATVQGVIAGRIDLLRSDDKSLLQALAVVGREFPRRLVYALTTLSDEQLSDSLLRLQDGEFIYEQPAAGEWAYTFKHALTQEVAYNSMLIERRKLLHDRIGAAIESIYEKSIDAHVVELAHHYQHSDNAGKAIYYLRLAGERSLSRSQFYEAVSNAASALHRLGAIEDVTERMRAELPIRLLQAQAATGALGYTATEVEKALLRALELGRQFADRQMIFYATGFLSIYHMIGAEHEKAKALAEELLALAKSENNAAWLGEVQYARGANLFWMGRFGEAMRALEESIRYCQDNEHPINVAGADTLGLARAYHASCLWYLGYPDKALQSRVETLARAEVTHQPYTMAAVLLNVCQMGLLRRDPATMNDIETLIALSEEHGFQLLQIWGSSFQAGALLQRHPSNEALCSLADYIARASEMKANLAGPIFWSFLAQAHVRMGNAATGLDVIATALHEIEHTSGRYIDAELHRLRGELLMISDPTNIEQAESEFRNAIEIARRQEAKSLELRATMSLARPLAKEGKRAEARAILAEIYGWFTEGFDTVDLKDAKMLLDELSA